MIDPLLLTHVHDELCDISIDIDDGAYDSHEDAEDLVMRLADVIDTIQHRKHDTKP